MKAAVFPEERNHFINKPGPSVNTWSQHISVTCPSSSAGAQVSAQQAHGNTGLLDGGRLLEAQSCDGLHGHREEGEGVRMEHRGDQGGGERRSWWRRDGGQGGVEMGVRVEERWGSGWRRESWYLQDRSGQIHVVKCQLIVILRCVLVERLWGLKTRRCYYGNTENKPVTSSAHLPHLLLHLSLSPPSFFFSESV